MLDERHILGEAAFAETVVWQVPLSIRGSAHDVHNEERAYRFKGAEQLLIDFWNDVEEMLE